MKKKQKTLCNKIEKELKKRLEKYREGAVIDLTADEEEKESSTEIPEEDVADLGDLGDDLAAV